MSGRSRGVRRLAAVLCAVGCVLGSSLALGSPPIAAADDGGVVLEPGIKHYGKTYNELAGDWWNWAGQFPLATGPITENGAVDCSRGQRGKIWFLAGNFGGAAGEVNPSERTCAIPRGKAIFIPLADSLFWVPEDGADVDAVRQLANGAIDAVSELEATIDGVVVPDLFAYRAQSSPGGFALKFGPLLADFRFGPLPDPRDPAVADGYWLLIEPLSRGAHTISVRSTIAPDTTIDVTYNITVGNVRD